MVVVVLVVVVVVVVAAVVVVVVVDKWKYVGGVRVCFDRPPHP